MLVDNKLLLLTFKAVAWGRYAA